MSEKIFRLSISNGGTVCDDFKWVRKSLTMDIREMQMEGGKSKMVTKKLEPWAVGEWSDGSPSLSTYPGFWAQIKAEAAQRGYTLEVKDHRHQLPTPNVGHAIRGMRAPQRAWFVNALVMGQSGLLGAPTRFGKSYAILGYCKAYEGQGLKIVVAAPGKDLCRQLYDFLVKEMPRSKVHGVWSGGPNRVMSEDITVCSVDSLDKMLDPDLLLIDEPHACVADGRLLKINAFERAVRVGFGATLTGRFDKKDKLIIGLIGPVLSSVSYKQAVEEGAISPLKVIIKKIRFSKDTTPGVMRRDHVYDRLMRRSLSFCNMLKRFCSYCIPSDWQTMVFIAHEKQADFVMSKSLPEDATVAMAKKLTNKERDRITSGIAANLYKRIAASRIYVQGVTFPYLKVVINAEGGGANTSAIQKPGRLLQIMPGKRYGVFVDFLFVCDDEESDTRSVKPYGCVVGECYARIKAYQEIGYDVIFEDDEEVIKKIIADSYESEN